MSSFLAYTSITVLMLVGILLIFIVLLQRGRGGGLAGALGGAGGQSALGTKAGDVFTKITIGLAAIWILLACLSIYALRNDAQSQTSGFVAPDAAQTETETESGSMTATGEAETEGAEATAPPSAAETASPTETAADTPANDAAESTEGPSLGAPPETGTATEAEAETAPAEPATAQ